MRKGRAVGYAEGAGALDAEAVVNLVLDRGADIDAADNRGRTALMIAADAGHAGMVDVLIARGAMRDLKDKDGKTALDLTADNAIRDRLRAK